MKRTFKHLAHLICLLTLLCLVPAAPAWAQAPDDDVLEFAMITDIHQFGPTADLRYADTNVREFVSYCNSHPQLSFALFGGDAFNSYDTDHAQALGYLHQAADEFSQIHLPFYSTRGNHDCNGKRRLPDRRPDNSQIVTDAEYFQIFSPICETGPMYAPEGIVTDPENPSGNYFYRDFEQQRVRFIMLNSYDRDSLEIYGYHGRQLKWLCEQALDFTGKDDATAWSFIIVGHCFFADHKEPFTRLMHAYVRGQDVFDTDEGITYGCRFSRQPRARCVGIIYGHFHEDIYTNWDGYNMIGLMRGYSTGSEPGKSDKCFDHFILNTRTHTLEERRIGRGQSRTYTYDIPQQVMPGLSFPEAEGMGQYTVGGKFGRIIHVTSLDDDGQGSLRWAVSQHGARTVVFDVAGHISLLSPIVIDNDSLTIAGQSSAGITISGAPLVVNASEVMLRYLSVGQVCDNEFGHSKLMIDHITAHCDSATALSVRFTKDVSVQYCHISTDSPSQPALVAGGFKATYHNNYICSSANAVLFGDHEGENRWIQFARNLVTDWRQHALYGGDHQGEFTIHENYFVPGPNTANVKMLDVARDGSARYYLSQNEIKGYEHLNRNKAKQINDLPGLAYTPQPADTVMRPFIHPIARPHDVEPGPTCLSRAPFNYVYIFSHLTPDKLLRRMLREAGSQYRPDSVSRDSLLQGDVLGYLDRIVKPERSIVILYDNDVHCAIDGYPYLEGLRDPTAADTAYVGIVSCGDFLQGGQAGSITHGQAVVDVMKHIRYDAIALGSHDFDFTLDKTRALLSDIGYPALCANLRHVGSDTLVFPAYTIRQYGRRRVAFVGVSSPSIEVTNRITFVNDEGQLCYDFDAPHLYQRVQHAVDEARHEGADFVIVLSQLGELMDRSGISAYGLIAATTGIDAVLDGHTHSIIPQQTLLNRIGRPVLYSQGGMGLTHVGKLVIDPDGRFCSELVQTQHLGYRDPAVSFVVDSIHSLYSASAEAFVGRSTIRLAKPKEFDPSDSLSINAGNLVCDAMRWATDADVAWLNVGSVRNSLPAGELTRGSIRDMLPYENNIVTLEVTGSQLLKIIFALFKNLPAEGGYLTPVSGITVQFSREKRRYRLLQAKIYDPVYSRYADINPNSTYRIATTDYCFTSIVKSFKLLQKKQGAEDTGMLYSEAVLHYINEQLNGLVEPTQRLRSERVVQLSY